ncbi:hypothetical protein GCM10027062_32740 [Nocardioides hungaricus]
MSTGFHAAQSGACCLPQDAAAASFIGASVGAPDGESLGVLDDDVGDVATGVSLEPPRDMRIPMATVMATTHALARRGARCLCLLGLGVLWEKS